MARFRVNAGIHVGPDLSADPVDVVDPATGKVTGKRYPPRTYREDEEFDSDTDIVAQHGAKFQLVDAGRRGRGAVPEHAPGVPGDPAPGVATANPSVAPGGQVSTGFQHSTSLPDGRTVSGPLSPELFGRAGALPAPETGQPGKAGGGPTADADLEEMHVDELRQLAQEEGAELHGAKTKAEIVKAVKAARRKK